MQNPPLLTRPEKAGSSVVPKWPFLLAGLGFFAALVAGNIYSERSSPAETEMTVRNTTEPLEVALDVSETQAAYPSAWAAYFDPTLMVLPNEQSYSKTYLARAAEAPAAQVDLSIHPPAYQFRRPFFRGDESLRAANQMPVPAARGWSKQEPTPEVQTVAAPAAETPTSSSVGIYGELQTRAILSMPEFPRLPGSDLLTPTEITVGVDSSGAVKIALLARSSGSDEADERALRLSSEVSFSPVSHQGDRLCWGLLKVFWIVDLRPAKL